MIFIIFVVNENQLNEIAAVADSKEEIELSDTSFEHTNKDETEDRVKEQALAKVMKQKEFYEKNLGIKLVPVGFRKANVGHAATRGAMVLEETIVTARKSLNSYQDAPKSANPYDSNAESSFDEVKYEAGIYVDFKIENSTK